MYTVREYLEDLEGANRAPLTIKSYRDTFKSYARFIGADLDEVHNHISADNLKKYALSQRDKSAKGAKMRLNVLRAYFAENGVVFTPMQMKIISSRRVQDPDDKPLEFELLQKMMDLSDTHAKAMIAALISTGDRAGSLCKWELRDLNIEIKEEGGKIFPQLAPLERRGDVVTIRNEISKFGHGREAYLNEEAMEFMNLWLRERADYINLADARVVGLVRSGGAKARPVDDQRVFACAYHSFQKIWQRLYEKTDGEKGRYGGNRCTPHSCRKYFRTNLVKTLGLDLVEMIMGHTGYLTNSYVRLNPEHVRSAYHEGEDALYITRRDRRMSENALEIEKMKRVKLEEDVEFLKRAMATKQDRV